MMTLQDVFTELALGELSSLFSSVLGSGRIDETREPQVTHYVNSGLLRLYSRFCMYEKEAIIDLLDHRTDYPLLPRHALTQQGQPGAGETYIRDSQDEPFIQDVLRVLSVTTDTGKLLPLNDPGVEEAAFTPRPDMVQIPCVERYNAVSVIYQAAHPKLSHERPEEEILLPVQLQPALNAWVAYKAYSGVGTMEANAKAKEHHDIYQTLCNEVEQLDLVSASRSVTTCKFEKNGWV